MRYLDNMLWIPRKEVNTENLEKLLTLRTVDFNDKVTYIKLYRHTSTHIGVPRAWGIKKFGPDFEDRTSFVEKEWPKLEIDYWPGQREAIRDVFGILACKKYGTCLEAPCGSGKTILGLAVSSLLKTPVLVVVHKTDLADQWKKSARDFFPGCKIGHIQQDEWDYKNKHVVTVLVQTLHSRIDSIPSDLWDHFGLVIYDEAHRFPSTTFETGLRLPKCKYRLCVSATYRRADKLERVLGYHVGNIEHSMEAERLTGEYVQVKWKTKFRDSNFRRGRKISFPIYVSAISKNRVYNDWLINQIMSAAKAGRKVLVVGDRIEQLQYLRKGILVGSLKTVGMYVGSLHGKRLTKSELQFAKKCDIILGTYKMVGEGTDIPDLDTLFLATPRRDVEQIVGRIQRKFEGKKSLVIVDPVFQTPYNVNMSQGREKYYSKLGFRRRED